MVSRFDRRPFVCGPLLAALLCAALAPIQARAQVVGATLSGTITDPSAAVIPNSEISIKNVATGVTETVKTNAAGFYTAVNLLPGNYQIRVSASGFSTEVRTGIILTVGSAQVLDVSLRVGKSSQTVQVAGAAPAVQLGSSALSAVVNSTTVRELPLNGRSWTDLATLQPGVDAIQAQPTFAVGADRGNRGYGGQITINGGRPQQNNYRLDGISINDYANGAPGSVLGGNLGVDAIEEFSVLTNSYSAEYGKTSGGVVNAISRSGTNQFHGSGYEFLRNSALDARNFFDLGTIPPFKRNQFGGAIGGPIQKDRTFFFADYEGIRQSKGITDISTVPSMAARSGQLCSQPNPLSSCTPTTVTVDPAAAQYLPFYPLPNAGIDLTTGGDAGTFAFPGQQVIREDFVTARLDHKFSDSDSIFGSYLFDNTPYHAPDPFNVVLLGNQTLRQIISVEETHIFGPTFVNSFRAGYNRDGVANDNTVKAINPLAADPTLGADPTRDATQVNISGISPFTGGVGANPTYFYFWNSWQAYDDALWNRGTHAVKFGVALEREDLNELVLRDPSGIFSFGSLQSFLTNQPSRFVTGVASTLTPRGLRQTIFGLYLQDDWRWKPNLTLNLGLRWEMATVPTEVQGKLSVLLTPTDATPHLGSPFFSNPTRRNFDPRIGFSWDPFHKGTTAIRGGFGLFDVLPLPYLFTLYSAQAAPFFSFGSVNSLPAGSFFQGAFPLLTASSLQAVYIEQHPHRSYVMQWNLNIQHAITPNLTATVGYVGSRGVHLPWVADDMDIVIPTATPSGYLWPCAPIVAGACTQYQAGTTQNPNFGDVRGLMFRGNSFYDALQVGLQRRLSHGLQTQASFTWGKSIDIGSAALAGDTFGNSISSLQWFDPRLNRALSDFNIGRTLVLNATWQVPAAKSLTGAAGWITNGWQLGGIYRASDGIPFTATFGTDGDPLGLNSSDPWDFPNRLSGPGCNSLINPGNPNNYIKTQCFQIPPVTAALLSQCSQVTPGTCFNLRGNAGRNIVPGPGTSNLDFSIFKNNHISRISENFNIQFRAEFFNILNHANFAVPVSPDSTDIFDSTGASTGIAGKLTSTTTTAREIQLAVKFIF
ncbi:MAG TPA: TonB-dependent receptor [Terriglobia bacterium]|nr:TonB-dependent receptor [Terriglobia bacterium]